jgi:hypothetical protein
MEPVSRRTLFKHAGAVAAVVAGGAAAGQLGLSSAGASTREGIGSALRQNESESALSSSEQLRPDENLVAHVKNARTGEISLFIGHREVTIHDRKVAARLVRATR